MIAGGYTLDLYCDKSNELHAYDEFPHTFISDEKNGKTLCFREARKAGWKITRDRTAICPKCNGKKTDVD